MLAAMFGDADYVSVLLEPDAHKPGADAEKDDAIFIAAAYRHASGVKMLLAARADKIMRSDTLINTLVAASQVGYTDVVRVMCDAGVCLNAMDMTENALMIASEHGHADVVKVLCDAGAGMDLTNKDGETAMMIASKCGHTDVVKLLHDAGADKNVKNKAAETAMMIAAKQGHEDIVRVLCGVSARGIVRRAGKMDVAHEDVETRARHVPKTKRRHSI